VDRLFSPPFTASLRDFGARHVPGTACALSSPTVPETAMQPRTVPALWLAALGEGRTTTAYLAERDVGWEPVSWAQAGERVSELASGLLALGIGKGDAFGILAATSVEWLLFDYALALVGAVTVPIYATSAPNDCAYALDHAEAVGVLAQDERQTGKLDEVRGLIPRVEHVLTFADLDDLAARGREFARTNPDALDGATAAVGEDDLYTFIYTSGTTGPPKACMITHRNAYGMATALRDAEEIVGKDDVVLLWLPLAHNFGRFLCLSGVSRGFTIAFVADPQGLAEALPQIRPTLLPSVPRVFEKVYEATRAAFTEQHGPRRKVVDWALRVGRRASALRQEGKELPVGLAVQHRLADRLVYSKVKQRLGGRVRLAVSGAAPLSVEVLEFFHALDVLILEGYGLSECTSGASVNRPDHYRFGTVGLPLPNMEARLAADGELLLRGPTIFAGYFKNEQATRDAVDEEGWLHTGDVAEIDPDGFIKITDRKKDILVTAGGKKVAPQNLENLLKGSKYVSQALVVGDRRPYIAALVALDEEAIGPWADEHGLPRDYAELSRRPEIGALVQGVVDDVNRGRSSFEQIKRFAILPRDFSADEGEVTPTLKLRRRLAEEHFAREIGELYAGEKIG
jgi:long-chain acyl-CoA synthetase